MPQHRLQHLLELFLSIVKDLFNIVMGPGDDMDSDKR